MNGSAVVEVTVGGLYDQRLSTVTVGTGAAKLLDANPDRVAVLFSPSGGQAITVSIEEGVTTSVGLDILATWTPYKISDADLPGLAGRAWWGIAAAAGSVVTIIEIVRVNS